MAMKAGKKRASKKTHSTTAKTRAKKGSRKRQARKRRTDRTILASLNEAVADASRQAFKDVLAGLPSSTAIGKFVDQLTSTSYHDIFHSLTLGEFAEAIGKVTAAPGRKSGLAQPAGRAKARKHNMRTVKGQEKLDAAVSKHLSRSGQASAENIRKVVGGTADQVRDSLARLADLGSVNRTGERRATRYSWTASKAVA